MFNWFRRKNINTIKEENRELLLSKAGVVGCGIGHKWTGGKDTGRDAIVIFVKEKLPAAALSDQDLIPPKIDGIKTDVIEVGELKPLNTRARHRPLKSGISAMWRNGTACTMNIVFRGNKPYALSNTHCFYPHWRGAKIGDEIWQPSPADGGTPQDKIGNTSDGYMLNFEGLPNKMDAAIAKIDEGIPYQAQVNGLGQPSADFAEPKYGMTLWKSSRTTGIRKDGRILAVNVTARVNYGAGIALFENQIFTDNQNGFVMGGDSGSVAYEAETLKPVAIVFAGSDRVGVLTPIRTVAEHFGISFRAKQEGYIAINKGWFSDREILVDGLRFRSSPLIGENIIRRLSRGEAIQIIEYAGYHSGWHWLKVLA